MIYLGPTITVFDPMMSSNDMLASRIRSPVVTPKFPHPTGGAVWGSKTDTSLGFGPGRGDGAVNTIRAGMAPMQRYPSATRVVEAPVVDRASEFPHYTGGALYDPEHEGGLLGSQKM